MPTAGRSRPGNQRNTGGMAHQAHAELRLVVAQASCLARSGTARCWRQLRTMGPKRGCASIQASARALLREKQKAASSTKGVVGERVGGRAHNARREGHRAGRAPQHALPLPVSRLAGLGGRWRTEASGDGSGAGLVGRHRLSVITRIGRAFLDGLGAMGEAGVNQALPIIHQELGQTVAAAAACDWHGGPRHPAAGHGTDLSGPPFRPAMHRALRARHARLARWRAPRCSPAGSASGRPGH